MVSFEMVSSRNALRMAYGLAELQILKTYVMLNLHAKVHIVSVLKLQLVVEPFLI